MIKLNASMKMYGFFLCPQRLYVESPTKLKIICRISPAFCTNLFNNKLIDVRLNKLTELAPKKDLSRGTPHNNHYSTNGDKLDPMWVTGFVDAEGCFSIIIDVSEPLK